MLNSYTKAIIYTADKIFVGNAEVAGKYGDQEVVLRMSRELADGMHASLIITLYNDAYGLITYKGQFIEYSEIPSEGDELLCEVKCELLEMLEIIQRRGNVKAKVSIPVTITLLGTQGTPMLDDESGTPVQHSVIIKDVSASGILFVTKELIDPGQHIDFLFSRCAAPFLVTAEVLRVQEYANGLNGYGCKFYGLSAAKESIIRQYVFKLQLLEHRNTQKVLE